MFINKLVTPRRGTHGVGECGEFPCPDVGVFRCFASLRGGYTPCGARCRVCEYQRGRINKGRSPQNCMACGCVSVRPSNAILRDDGLICFAPLRTSLSVLGAGVEAPRLFSRQLARTPYSADSVEQSTNYCSRNRH